MIKVCGDVGSDDGVNMGNVRTTIPIITDDQLLFLSKGVYVETSVTILSNYIIKYYFFIIIKWFGYPNSRLILSI